MQGTNFEARFAFTDAEREKFRLLDIKDSLGCDVFGELVGSEIVFADSDALKIAIAGTLGLKPSAVGLSLLEEPAVF